MNMNTTPAPPINNALQPDIYNRLDAEVIERTRVANTQLDMRLVLEEKIIAKYKREAERFRVMEKSQVAQDLKRINRKLPAITRIRDFDDKFFKKRSNSDPLPRRKKRKNYLEKNEEGICHRCYIHHLPTKKNFYRRETPSPPPSVFDKTTENQGNEATPPTDKTTDSPSATSPDKVERLVSPLKSLPTVPSFVERESPTKNNRFIPSVEKFKFLERDKYGREIDLNQTLTPRLMPYEAWKNVVKNVCSQCMKKEATGSPTYRDRRASKGIVRERTSDGRGLARKKSSLAMANKSRSESQPPSSLPNINGRSPYRGNSFRRPSIDTAKTPNTEGSSLSRQTSTIGRSPSTSSSLRRPSVDSGNKPQTSGKSFSRSSSTLANNDTLGKSSVRPSVNKAQGSDTAVTRSSSLLSKRNASRGNSFIRSPADGTK